MTLEFILRKLEMEEHVSIEEYTFLISECMRRIDMQSRIDKQKIKNLEERLQSDGN